MVYVCDDFSELKLIIRCVLTATKNSLTVDELWSTVIKAFGGGPKCVDLKVFDFSSFYELLKSIPDVVILEDPADTNSIVNLVSSELSKHIEQLVDTNIFKPQSEKKNQHNRRNLLVPYRVQCAFIRIFMELYPKGLLINNFVSNVLCFPIFKVLADSVDQLVYDLSHIFKRVNMDMITLQPTIVNSVKNIIEEDKFLAMDIYNIDEFSLENSEFDYKIAKGIEYPLFYLLEESIKQNIESLLDDEPNGILEREINDLYIQKFGSSFSHYRRWGFSRVSQLFSNLPELCCVNFLKEEIKIVSKKSNMCDIYKKTNVIEKVNEQEHFISKKDETNNRPNNDGVLYQYLKNDNFLLASLDDCFLDRKFQQIELKVNTSLNVTICEVNMDNLPTIKCQIIDESFKLNTLLKDMKIFYFLNESKFQFNIKTIMTKQIYAFNLDDSWFRGSVIRYQFNDIKIMNIDNGLTYIIPPEDIRLLHKKFSQLPAQAFICFLDGISFVNKKELEQIVNKKCTICITSVDHHCKTAFIKIKLFNSTSNDYLNDEWIKNGYAKPDNSLDSE